MRHPDVPPDPGEATNSQHSLHSPLEPGERLAAVVVAAGESTRMAGVDKIFTPLLDVPVIAHSAEAIESSPLVSDWVLVLPKDRVGRGKYLARSRGWSKLTCVCAGGPRRQDSVRLGLERLSRAEGFWVAIHDGARPCIGSDLLERGVEAARETGASVAAVPAKDTVKVVSSQRIVESTPPRDTLWLVQTPQVFRYDLLLDAHRACHDTFTDDAAMVESLGHSVKVFMGSYSNLKVTTVEDLAIAKLFLKARQRPEGETAEETAWQQG